MCWSRLTPLWVGTDDGYKGFTLLEVLIAMAIFSIVGLASFEFSVLFGTLIA